MFDEFDLNFRGQVEVYYEYTYLPSEQPPHILISMHTYTTIIYQNDININNNRQMKFLKHEKSPTFTSVSFLCFFAALLQHISNKNKNIQKQNRKKIKEAKKHHNIYHTDLKELHYKLHICRLELLEAPTELSSNLGIELTGV